MSSGFTDKLYWRRTSSGVHCFKRSDEKEKGQVVLYSLCDRVRIVRCGGGMLLRPPPYMRCPICDGSEMDRRGWNESGPESDGWQDIRLNIRITTYQAFEGEDGVQFVLESE